MTSGVAKGGGGQPTQVPLEWHTPIIVEIVGEEREAILREERAEQAAADKSAALAANGDGCCAIAGNGELAPDYLYDHAAFKARLADEPASGGYPPGFADWPLERRNKWFGANTAAILADSDHLVGRRPEESDEPFILPNLGAEAKAPTPRKITLTPYVWRDPATIPMRRWLYGKHYIRKFLSATMAAGGLGKSSLDLVEAIAMAAGRNLLGVPVPVRVRVAYWGEDPVDEIERRVAAILLHFKIPPEEVEGWLFTDSFRKVPLNIAALERGVMVYPDAEAVTKALIENNIDVLILDPFVKTHSVPENDNAAIDRIARKFSDIAEETNCAVELAHHVRKASNFGRAEVTADDGRGAGSLKDAARCVRVMNRMAADEATAAQVKEKDRKRYFRVDDDGKTNMTAPAESAAWFRFVSIHLYNDVSDPNAHGDSIGVVESWKLPGVFAGLSIYDLPRVQAAIERGGPWARDVQNKDDWAGIAIAQTLDLDLMDPGAKERVKNLLSAWIESGALKVATRPNPKRKDRTQKIVIVGNPVEGKSDDET